MNTPVAIPKSRRKKPLHQASTEPPSSSCCIISPRIDKKKVEEEKERKAERNKIRKQNKTRKPDRLALEKPALFNRCMRKKGIPVTPKLVWEVVIVASYKKTISTVIS